MFKRKPKVLTPAQVEEIRTKDFFDCIELRHLPCFESVAECLQPKQFWNP